MDERFYIATSSLVELIEPYFLFFNSRKEKPDLIKFHLDKDHLCVLVFSNSSSTAFNLLNSVEVFNHELKNDLIFVFDYPDFILNAYRFIRMLPEQPITVLIEKADPITTLSFIGEAFKFKVTDFNYGINNLKA